MPGPEDVEITFPDHGCFGCSPTRPDGLRMRFWRRGAGVVSEHAIPDGYHGAPGVAHGGIVATLFDEMSCAAGAAVFCGPVVTGELSVRFERPIPVGTPLQWEAEVEDATHPRYVVVVATVQHGGELLARATSRIFRHPSVPAP